MALQEIYKQLELTDKGCLIRLSDENWEKKVSLPSRVSRLLKKNDLLKTLDGFFCFDNKPLILFFENPDKKQKQNLHQAIWNFNESPVVIIVENNAVEIFNGFAIDEKTKLLKFLGGKERLNDFTYFKLVTGKTWKDYKKEIRQQNRVDYRLLDNIGAAQKLLKKQGLTRTIANALLGKIIFFRYLIDRKVQLHYQKKETWSNDDLCNCLKNVGEFKAFVRYIEDKETGFNGDMFHLEDSEFETINQASLNVLIRLLQSEDLSDGQKSLFDIYDFSILPIEFISNVYERFIGKENQKKKGAYYTPTFLVDYMVSETVGKKLKETNDYNCKVLDPACGSGIFLVESLRRMIEKYISVNNVEDSSTNTKEFRDVLRQIVVDNIFGIDEDYSAIQVAIFSVYLTLLDYQSSDIENFKFPNLMETNFICSDTFAMDNKELKAFEERKHAFDFILGNPPWKRGGVKRHSPCEKYLKQQGYLSIIGNRELAQAFVLRSLDFTCSKTQCALVLVSKVLYNIESKGFRACLLDKVFINQVFELASVRKEVFNKSNDPAIAPSCILFYRNAEGKATDDNVIVHIALKASRFFSLFKIFSLTRNDIQRVQQDRLKQYDWLWKVLVYGSYLDFLFIKRLKEKQRIADIPGFVVPKHGIKIKDGNKKVDVSTLCGCKYTKPKDVFDYFIVDSSEKWKRKEAGFARKLQHGKGDLDIAMYKSPILLIKKGTATDLKKSAAISYVDTVYNDTLAGVKFNSDNQIRILRNLLGLLNSSLFAYCNLLSFSSSGIEREQTFDDENISLPYCEGLDESVEKVEAMIKNFHTSTMVDSREEDKIKQQKERIDALIFEKFSCSQQELDLIDFASTISIPLATKCRNYDKVFDKIGHNEDLLRKYADVFLNRFARSFNKNQKRFVVEIQYTPQIIGMFFKVIDEKDFNEEITLIANDNILSALMVRLSSEKITNELFVQKDIRGFEKDCFYIFKPNEKRLWHRAIAYLDVNEFADAMLRVGGGDE